MSDDTKRFSKLDVKDPTFVKSLRLEPVVQGATVDWVRSEDHHVYLTAQHVKGWALITDPFSFSILAAARASNITVSFQARSYDPDYGDGAGYFEGVEQVRFQGTPF